MDFNVIWKGEKMTPKDTLYKLRQAEFRKLNKRYLKLDATGKPVLEEIVHKEKYTGVKGR